MDDPKPQTPEMQAAEACEDTFAAAYQGVVVYSALYDEAEARVLKINAAHYLPILNTACDLCEGPEALKCHPCAISIERDRLLKGLS
jgi:hypothetical protein